VTKQLQRRSRRTPKVEHERFKRQGHSLIVSARISLDEERDAYLIDLVREAQPVAGLMRALLRVGLRTLLAEVPVEGDGRPASAHASTQQVLALIQLHSSLRHQPPERPAIQAHEPLGDLTLEQASG
jgi:hypothetical protein